MNPRDVTPGSTIFFLILQLFFNATWTNAQHVERNIRFIQAGQDLFGKGACFIENIGQYGNTITGYDHMGKIMAGYEGFASPVLFTTKGLIFIQKDFKQKIQNILTMEWDGANTKPLFEWQNVSQALHGYDTIPIQARGFKKMLVKDLYPGIDVEYLFQTGNKAGFEYRLLVHPGADLSKIKMKYGGDFNRLDKDSAGNLVIKSTLGSILQSSPLALIDYETEKKPEVVFKVESNTVGFQITNGYKQDRLLIIDPFISIASLAGTNSGKAIDVDFDYAGNVYVSGGGSLMVHLLAKYNSSGGLLWTFSGSLSTPYWRFDGYGGWLVEKSSGLVYLGDGHSANVRVIRINSSGVFDSYITSIYGDWQENSKMLYTCISGAGTIVCAGGGSDENKELVTLAPPSNNPYGYNITGLSGGLNDISDFVIDQNTNDLYSIIPPHYVLHPGRDDFIYKHKAPYTVADLYWKVPTGLFVMETHANRPYLVGNANSSNTLAVNAGYVFYWDGKNLKAFNKTDGSPAGAVLTLATNTELMQGGVYADNCNNVFVGNRGGEIKVYHFDGSTFNDAAVPDLSNGQGTAVYDLLFDSDKKLLYACGNGFVAAFDISGYCTRQAYEIRVQPDCASSSATATLIPGPVPGMSLSYVLSSGPTIISTNSTGIFTALAPGPYTITVYINQACNGMQTSLNFNFEPPPILNVTTPLSVCDPLTADLTSPLISAGSSPGLNFTYWLDAAATIPYNTPASATPGLYYIKGTAATGCFAIAPVRVNALPSPVADAGKDVTICFLQDTQLGGSGGVSFSWTPSRFLNNASLSNPIVRNVPPGVYNYVLQVTGNNGCRSAPDTVVVTVKSLGKIFLTADTAIVVNQPLQLNPIDINGLGLNNFTWTPSYGLNDPLIQNPVAILDRDMLYTLTSSTNGICPATAAIKVRVFKQPDIYVPNAFTPDNNGLNDVLKAIPVGLKTFRYFRVFSRQGQLIFSTTDPRKGWDGKIGGVEQGSGVFVWYAEGMDYTGRTIFKKGITTIVR